jgi:hypothetical protein
MQGILSVQEGNEQEVIDSIRWHDPSLPEDDSEAFTEWLKRRTAEIVVMHRKETTPTPTGEDLFS